MTKIVVICSLLALALAAVGASVWSGQPLFSDAWSQVFWLAAGTLVTTFVLEAVLQADESARRRSDDAFAYRVFLGTMLVALHRMAGLSDTSRSVATGEAVFDAKAFAAASEQLSVAIAGATDLDIEAYREKGRDMAGAIMDVSRNYIRVFCADKAEMVRRYLELQELAGRWRYVDELSEGFIKFTSESDPGSTSRLAREASTAKARTDVLGLVKQTARSLRDTAVRATQTKARMMK
jgi:hypothetical protein